MIQHSDESSNDPSSIASVVASRHLVKCSTDESKDSACDSAASCIIFKSTSGEGRPKKTWKESGNHEKLKYSSFIITSWPSSHWLLVNPSSATWPNPLKRCNSLFPHRSEASSDKSMLGKFWLPSNGEFVRLWGLRSAWNVISPGGTVLSAVTFLAISVSPMYVTFTSSKIAMQGW